MSNVPELSLGVHDLRHAGRCAGMSLRLAKELGSMLVCAPGPDMSWQPNQLSS